MALKDTPNSVDIAGTKQESLGISTELVKLTKKLQFFLCKAIQYILTSVCSAITTNGIGRQVGADVSRAEKRHLDVSVSKLCSQAVKEGLQCML